MIPGARTAWKKYTSQEYVNNCWTAGSVMDIRGSQEDELWGRCCEEMGGAPGDVQHVHVVVSMLRFRFNEHNIVSKYHFCLR